MSIPVAHRDERLQARQTHPRERLDAAIESAIERAARPGMEDEAAARPEMNRQERLIFTVYLVLGTLIALFLGATGLLWWLGG